jgi:hypothetical protein
MSVYSSLEGKAKIDSLYPNETEMAFYPGVYLSRTYADSFYIRYLVWPGDAIISWGGNVSLTTGIPVMVENVSEYYSVGVYINNRLIFVT